MRDIGGFFLGGNIPVEHVGHVLKAIYLAGGSGLQCEPVLGGIVPRGATKPKALAHQPKGKTERAEGEPEFRLRHGHKPKSQTIWETLAAGPQDMAALRAAVRAEHGSESGISTALDRLLKGKYIKRIDTGTYAII